MTKIDECKYCGEFCELDLGASAVYGANICADCSACAREEHPEWFDDEPTWLDELVYDLGFDL
jgi:hypothetical protein